MEGTDDESVDKETRLAYATVLSNWCRVQWLSGDIRPAVYEGLEQVLRIRTNVLGWCHPDVASAHYNLGVTEYAHNHCDLALEHLMQYLRIAAVQQQQDNAVPSEASKISKLDLVPALIYILLVKNEESEERVHQELVRGFFERILITSV